MTDSQNLPRAEGPTPPAGAEASGSPASSRSAPAGAGVSAGDIEAVETLRRSYLEIRKELSRVIVGQDEVLEQILISIFARGHCLLVGVPGLAKTLIISTLARCLSLSFSRIQFTPDLMPSDITGTEVIQEDRATGERKFRFLKGPVFANVILADEINRTPPKTQAALLEAMQERQVTAGGTKHSLEEPFFVLATQNPIEQEGTYPLPEAQLDRFMFMIRVDYPSEEEEVEIMKRTTAGPPEDVSTILSGEQILALQEIVRRVPVADDVIRYVLRLTRATRVTKDDAPDYLKQWLAWGAGPRASQFLILGGKARAVLHGRKHVAIEDVQAVAQPVLRHRILTNFSAEAEGVTSDRIIERLLGETPVTEMKRLRDATAPGVL
ncbi:MAG: MoxR family ATPase [Planctomycetes bacterium]|nr:MoxR family ATPase [Planctomycetota bacterium]